MSCDVQWGGEALQLLAERALWWPRVRTLFVADVHLGKAASYRALGMPVPSGTTADNLTRLGDLIDRLGAQRLVFLGDLLHAERAQQTATMDAVRAWRERYDNVAMLLVRGNHDKRAGDPPASLGIVVADEPLLLGPFACNHAPLPHPTHFVLCGHVHPVCTIHGPGRDRLRLPCFVEEGRCAILPAFGAFTGGWEAGPEPARRRYCIGGERVWELPPPLV